MIRITGSTVGIWSSDKFPIATVIFLFILCTCMFILYCREKKKRFKLEERLFLERKIG